MAADRLPDRHTPAPAQTTALATLDADALAPDEIAATLRFAAARLGQHPPGLRRRLGAFRHLVRRTRRQPPALPARPDVPATSPRSPRAGSGRPPSAAAPRASPMSTG